MLPSPSMKQVTLDDFERIEMRVGRVVEARAFEEARKPAYVLQIDFGEELGVKKASAQITARYAPEDLLGRLVVAVTNFPPRQIGPLMSECRVLGFELETGGVTLCVPDGEVPLGTRLS